MTTPKLVEHFFRHEYGRLVAMLSRRVGVQYVEFVEDAVQSALMKALEAWTIAGLPDNPSAWLYRVAHNDLLGELRQRTNRSRILEQYGNDAVGALENDPECRMTGEVQDDLLQMLFLSCDEAIPVDSQLVFALKTLCGFEIREIALRLEEQDRTLWDRQKIQIGLAWLAKSAQGDGFSRYHAEAGIAAEHCLARVFEETRWERVVACYALLERTAPSPIHRLNRAVAVAEWRGPAAGLALLDGFEPPAWLVCSYLWSAVLADLHRRCGLRTCN